MNKRRNFFWMMSIGALFLLLTNLVYLNFARHANSDYRYTGATMHAAVDKLVYFSMIEQGKEGLLFMKNLHTTDPQRGLLLSPHWYLIGQTSRLLHISSLAAYQSYRILFIVLFLILLYRLLPALFSRARDRLFASLFVLLSGGFGWFWLLFHPALLDIRGQLKFFLYPVDLYVTEGNTLLNFTQSPLFSLSQLLLLFIFLSFVKHRDDRGYRWSAVAALTAAALILIHPYDGPIIIAVLGSWSVWNMTVTREWISFRKLVPILLGVAASVLYNWYMLRADPVLAEWLKQNLVFSPPLRNYLLGYGLLLPLWLVGVVAVLRKKFRDPWWMLFVIWSSIGWVMIYSPLAINRRFVNGWHIALALVAYYGFRWVLAQVRRRWLSVSVTVIAVIGLFGPIGPFVWISTYFRPSAYTEGSYYRSIEDDRMIAFLARESASDDHLMLSDLKSAYLLTSRLPRPVFRGHEHQTPRSHLRRQQADWFFGTNSGNGALIRKSAFLKENSIRFVIVNGQWREGPAAWLGDASFLQEVYRSGNYIIYRVVS